MRSILYRFPDLQHFGEMVRGMGETELELGLPSGEGVEDGEWVLAIFELGAARRATSAAARANLSPDGPCLMFEPRDWRRLADFAETEAERPALARSTHVSERASRSNPPPARSRRSNPPPERSGRSSARPRGASRAPNVQDEATIVPETAKSAQAPLPNARVPSSGSGRPGPPAHVLVVDDDPDIRDVVSAMLEAVGLVVTQAASAEEALQRVQREPFDLMVLDWNLPKMTGLDLCRLIRREAGLAALPVLFLTANASSQDMVDAFASGADDYVVKPFRAPELGARIFSLLRRTRASVP